MLIIKVSKKNKSILKKFLNEKIVKESTIMTSLLTVRASSSSFVANTDSMVTKSDHFDKLDKRIQEKLRGMTFGMYNTMIYSGKN